MDETNGDSLFDTLDSFADDTGGFGASTKDYSGGGSQIRDNREGHVPL